MDPKTQIESRINRVTGYTGTQHLPGILGISTTRQKLGSDPRWLTARACMTPEEFTAFGRDGRPWYFLHGKPDLAQKCVEVSRAVVESECAKMELDCNWGFIAQYRPVPMRSGADIPAHRWEELRSILRKFAKNHIVPKHDDQKSARQIGDELAAAQEEWSEELRA